MKATVVSGPPELGACPSDFGLERLRHGELDGSEGGRSAAHHVEHCASCAARTAALAAEPPPFALDDVWRAARATRSSQGRPSVRIADSLARPVFMRRLVLASVFAATAAAAVLALRLRPVPATDLDLIKGGPWSLTVIAKTRAERDAVVVASGARLSRGDRLRFQVSTAWAVGYVAIISLDSTGAVSSLAPTAGNTIEVHPGRPVLLDGAVELDDSKGSERIELVGCPRPADAAKLAGAAAAALARAGGDLRKVGPIASGCYQQTFWIEKATP